MRLVNDNVTNIKVGIYIIDITKGLSTRRSFGNIVEKYKKLGAIILDVVKLIFPQNNIDGVSLK
jgi:hypothetical protein